MFYRPVKKYKKTRIDGQTLSERRLGRDPEYYANWQQLNRPMNAAKYNYEKLVGTRSTSGVRNLQRLSPAHRAVVAAHLQGLSNVEIAELLDRSGGWVSGVLNDPLVKGLIDRFMSGVEGELEALFPKAVGAVRSALDDENPLTQLKAVDRFVAMSKRFEKKEGSASAEDVIKKALELARDSVRTVAAGQAGRHLVIDSRPLEQPTQLAALPSPMEEDNGNDSEADGS